MVMRGRRRLVVGISGASGVIFGVRLLEQLALRPDIETHLVITDAARLTLAHEMGITSRQLRELVAAEHDVRNLAAPIASGSFRIMGMVIAPCSMNTLSAIAYSQASNLLTRAADVCLKERRPLVLIPRETPLHLGHLRAMVQAAELGAVILPPMPAFYHHPATIDDLVLHIVGKVFDQLGLEHDLFQRWGEAETTGRACEE
jgi:4-hydroxy-3-polyprenylbenzoate decarboxylase